MESVNVFFDFFGANFFVFGASNVLSVSPKHFPPVRVVILALQERYAPLWSGLGFTENMSSATEDGDTFRVCIGKIITYFLKLYRKQNFL